MAADVTHDEAGHMFVLAAEGGSATLSYAPVNETTVDFQSTYVPHALRGRGVGARLVLVALDWAKERGLRVVPSCWFVSDVIARRPEYRSLLAP